ncbi:hypothetical protein [Streptomyces sp. NPDC057094]
MCPCRAFLRRIFADTLLTDQVGEANPSPPVRAAVTTFQDRATKV